jgi:hypothetical protein
VIKKGGLYGALPVTISILYLPYCTKHQKHGKNLTYPHYNSVNRICQVILIKFCNNHYFVLVKINNDENKKENTK